MNHATQKRVQNKPKARLPICPPKNIIRNKAGSQRWYQARSKYGQTPVFAGGLIFWGLNLESCIFLGYPKQP